MAVDLPATVAWHDPRRGRVRVRLEPGTPLDTPDRVEAARRLGLDQDPQTPAGSVADVQAWVGDDPGRAVVALLDENDRARPRSSLVAWLEQRLADSDDGSADYAGAPGDPSDLQEVHP